MTVIISQPKPKPVKLAPSLPFTLHFSQQRDKKMSGEIKFKGHPCLTFTGKSWIQRPFYENLVMILNVSQQKEVENETP